MERKYIKKMTKEQAKAYAEAWGQPIDKETKAMIEKNRKAREQAKNRAKKK